MNPHNVAPLLTIGLVTDLHYAPITVGNRYCRESLTKLQAAVAFLKKQKLDVTVCLGDVIDKSETVEEEIGRVREVSECLGTLSAEAHFVLGNHDVSELTKDQFLSACGSKASYYSFDCRGVHIVVLDSNVNPDGSDFSPGNFHWANAWIGEAQIAWLRDDLAEAVDTPVLVVCHANLDDRMLKSGELDGHIVRDAATVRDVLESSGNVKAVIQGHCHSGLTTVINGIPYIVLRAMVEGSGLEQNACGVLSLFEDGTVTLKGFGQQPSLCFDGKAFVEYSQDGLFLSPPVIQQATENGFTVSIEVNRLSAGRVEWGLSPDRLDSVAISAHGGLINAHDQCVMIPVIFDKPLDAGEAIHYRVIAKPLDYGSAYNISHGSAVETDVRRLSIPHPEDEALTLAVISDTHENVETVSRLSERIEACDPHLLVWNGDVCNVLHSDKNSAALTLRPGTQTPEPSSLGGWASSRPLVYVPGNHGKRGNEANTLSNFFATGPHHGLPYNTAIRIGPLAVLCLDAGEDKPDRHPVFGGTAAYEPYRERQAEWLTTQLARPEIAKAPFKLAFSHIPLRGLAGQNDGSTLEGYAKYSGQGAQLWLPQLVDAGFHAVLSGHTHDWRYDDPTDELPITQVVGGGPNTDNAVLIVIEVSTSQLTVRTEDLNGQTLDSRTWIKD